MNEITKLELVKDLKKPLKLTILETLSFLLFFGLRVESSDTLNCWTSSRNSDIFEASEIEPISHFLNEITKLLRFKVLKNL